jgi:hypothetical protein
MLHSRLSLTRHGTGNIFNFYVYNFIFQPLSGHNAIIHSIYMWVSWEFTACILDIRYTILLLDWVTISFYYFYFPKKKNELPSLQLFTVFLIFMKRLSKRIIILLFDSATSSLKQKYTRDCNMCFFLSSLYQINVPCFERHIYLSLLLLLSSCHCW